MTLLTSDRCGGRQDVFQSGIKRRRLALGLSQEALAYRAGVSLATVRRLETGYRSNPFLGTVEKIAAVLGCSVNDLV